MEQNSMEKEIIAQLERGRKTWTELMENVQMSSRTLVKHLTSLMDNGIVVKYGIVEYGKIVDYYDLVKKKDAEIVVKVPRMFEKGNFAFPLRIKKDLDIEQDLVRGIYSDVAQRMHFARKVMDVKFARELSPKQRIEYIDNWKREAVDYASDWMDSFIEGIARASEIFIASPMFLFANPLQRRTCFAGNKRESGVSNGHSIEK